MPELIMQGRKYEIVTTEDSYVKNVLARNKCTIRIEYGYFKKTHFAALRALRDAGHELLDYNYEVHLRVVCERCQKGLTPTAIGLLIMSQDENIEVVSLQRGQVRGNQCLSCGNRYCYLVYDPDGFPKPETS